MTDPLTIAYLALGAPLALIEHKGLPENYCGGELEFISEIIAYADEIDMHFHPGEFDGVWVYDVVEPFGHWYATERFKGDTPSKAAIVAQLNSLIRRYG